MANLINIHGARVPNPRAIKFELEGTLLTTGAFEYNSKEEAQSSPLAAKLFLNPHISRVFIAKDFVTVTKTPAEEPSWEQIMPEIRRTIKEHIEADLPVLDQDSSTPYKEPEFSDDLPGYLAQMIEEKIRPATYQDGGDITFHSYQDGVLKVNLAGACKECPFASRTVKAGIEKLAMALFPEVKEVTSEDIDWAQTQQQE